LPGGLIELGSLRKEGSRYAVPAFAGSLREDAVAHPLALLHHLLFGEWLGCSIQFQYRQITCHMSSPEPFRRLAIWEMLEGPCVPAGAQAPNAGLTAWACGSSKGHRA